MLTPCPRCGAFNRIPESPKKYGRYRCGTCGGPLRIAPSDAGFDIQHCCRVLGVEPSASPEQIKEAYYDLVKIWHPDRFPNDLRLQQKAQDRLKDINYAYERLVQLQTHGTTRAPSSSSDTEAPRPVAAAKSNQAESDTPFASKNPVSASSSRSSIFMPLAVVASVFGAAYALAYVLSHFASTPSTKIPSSWDVPSVVPSAETGSGPRTSPSGRVEEKVERTERTSAVPAPLATKPQTKPKRRLTIEDLDAAARELATKPQAKPKSSLARSACSEPRQIPVSLATGTQIAAPRRASGSGVLKVSNGGTCQ